MSASTSSEFARAMEPLAISFLGKPNEELSSRDELRFGARGSFSVDRRKGTWCDHENGSTGGGALDFVMQRKQLEKFDALEWMRAQGYIPDAEGAKRTVAIYDYHDAAGQLIFQVVRFSPKDFRQRRPDAGARDGFTWKTAGLKLPLYNLRAVLAAVEAGQTVFIAEGEKSVDALGKLGVVATCSPGGAGKWKAHHSPALKGADVVLLPDNDEAGREHVAKVKAALSGHACRVRTLALPGLPEKGDPFDWIGAGGTREALEALLHDVPDDEQPETSRRHEDDAPEPETSRRHEDAAIEQVVEEFNARYCVVNEGGKAVIFQEGYDLVLKRSIIDRLTTRDLQTLYMNAMVKVGMGENDRPIYKSKADIWLRHPDRRQYIGGVTFDPSNSKPAEGILNLWKGFAIKPRPGHWDLLRDHVLNIICGGDAVRFDYLIQWAARMLQRPAEQGETCVVMKGLEGCGKGIFARALLHIVGHHGMAVSTAKHLVGSFNSHLRDLICLFADEAFFAGDRAHANVLKSIITEPTLAFEAKFANTKPGPNFLHVLMASNNDWVVPAAVESRRFFVLQVLPDKIGNFGYFEAIWRQMQAGGFEAMLHDLLHMNLTHFNVRRVPTTEALQEQRKMSLGTTERWWMDVLERGFIYESRIGLHDVFSAWEDAAATELLFKSYTAFAKSAGERHPLIRESLGAFMVKLGAQPTRLRSRLIGEEIRDVDNAFGGSSRKGVPIRSGVAKPAYRVGTLDEARAAFTKLTGLFVDWDSGTEQGETPQPTQPSSATTALCDEPPAWPGYHEAAD